METARLRLVFEDPNILSKSQKKQGLKRSCYENSVKMKGGKSTEIIKAGNGMNYLEGLETMERLPVNIGVKHLANEEFDKETGGYKSELEEGEQELAPLEDQAQVESTPIENMVSKKRKARDKLPSSRKKKSKLASAEKYPVSGDDGIDVRPKKNKSSHKKKVSTNDKVVGKDKPADIQGEPENSSSPEIDETGDDKTNLGRSSQLQNTGKGSADELITTTEVKKLPSRSARRKKAKRRWLREQAKLVKEKLQSKELLGKDDQQSPAKENLKFSEECLQAISNNDVEDNVVPVVVRPGHIRFEPLEEENAEQAIQHSQISVFEELYCLAAIGCQGEGGWGSYLKRKGKEGREGLKTFQWNGITSKKKGQKWGMEKTPFLKRNDNSFSHVSSEMVDVNDKATVTNDMDFDKLMPYSSLPKEGDLVAYRLVELSSTWTPELCSFRVGEISHYDAESNRIMLTPVPGYPNASEKKTDEEASELPDTSLYGEDGSLEAYYSSLIDVRLVKLGNSNATIAIADDNNENYAQNQDVLTRQPNGSKEANSVSAASPAQANGAVNVWEELNQALSAKKAELSKEDGWSRADSSGRSAWSFRALRRSALGPTMAFLRAQNGI
ncbi:coilin isoform X1 [Gossypium australe]|uniref:Coilin isoform X1 n=1 Tax=Gossypium australe TaxID=47621 RepID=A0A5B6V986_9ROSI|nr:coilin isoform X1 [Gossypium australe]